MQKVTIASIKIDNLSFPEVLSRIEHLIRKNNQAYVVTPNVDHIVKLEKDKKFLKIYQDADLVLADGKPLIWASKYLGTPIKERVAGSDLFTKLCAVASKKNYKVFLLGGRPGAAVKARQNLEALYPGLNISGTYCPPFGFEHDKNENDKIIQAIKTAKPDILFVGLGAPKQEKWIFNHVQVLNVPVSIGIGVSIEFSAGMVKRAPLFMQKFGFEWLWRLIMEPEKLWKRYLVDDTKFFGLILRQKRRVS